MAFRRKKSEEFSEEDYRSADARGRSGRNDRDRRDYYERRIDNRYGRDDRAGYRDDRAGYRDDRAGYRDDRAGYRDDRRRTGREPEPLSREALKKKKQRNKLAARILIMLIAFVIVLALGAMLYIQATLGKIGRDNTTDRIAVSSETFVADTSKADTIEASDVDLNADDIQLMDDDAIKNILCVGIDQREGEKSRARSDSMILVSINTRTNQITLTSFMRDMYVQIPGYSDNKINASYAFGGMDLLDETIEKNFGVDIDGNVAVNLENFIKALTQVGNLDINLKEEEAEYLNLHNGYGSADDSPKSEVWNLHEGMNNMTPEQVLAYARIRYVGNSDWERTERQRTVITTAFDKARKDSSLPEMISLADHIIPYITTDMDDKELLSVVKTVYSKDMQITESHRIPVDDSYSREIIHGMDCLVPDLSENSKELQSYIYGDVLEAE